MKILICDESQELAWHLDEEIKALQAGLADAEVDCLAYTDEAALRKALVGVDALLTSFIPLPGAVLDAAKDLQVISIKAVGVDNVDLSAAKQNGIALYNVRDYCTEEVADHTLAMMLSLARHLKAYDQKIGRTYHGELSAEPPLQRLSGKKLAIFGWGKIGQAVARRAQAFGLQVMVVSGHLTEDQARQADVRRVSAAEALAEADIVTNHMRQTPERFHYFAAESFEQMKKQPIFINNGRAEAVDEDALLTALSASRISAAGLDVWQAQAGELTAKGLANRDNVILTPHAAFLSVEAEQELFTQAVDHIVRHFST